MAKQLGVIFIEDTLGGINFYYKKGVPTARVARGVLEKPKKRGNIARVRESNSEFAGCSQVNKFFKQAIRAFLFGYKGGTLHVRLMQLFLKIKDCDAFSVAVSGGGMLFAIARVSFYQDVNGAPYLLSGGGAYGVAVLGVGDV